MHSNSWGESEKILLTRVLLSTQFYAMIQSCSPRNLMSCTSKDYSYSQDQAKLTHSTKMMPTLPTRDDGDDALLMLSGSQRECSEMIRGVSYQPDKSLSAPGTTGLLLFRFVSAPARAKNEASNPGGGTDAINHSHSIADERSSDSVPSF